VNLYNFEYGLIDLEKLFKTYNGKMESNLTDLGSKWLVSGNYEWKINHNNIKITPKNNNFSITLPKKIPITGPFLAFIGLYDGDGNKTRGSPRPIGFSQREMNIHRFAHDMLHSFFSNQFETKWSLLEDSKRFETPQKRRELSRFRSTSNKYSNFSNNDLIKEFVKREFLDSATRVGLTVTLNQISTPVISPKKGARALGKSSLEYIQNMKHSEKFLAFWLKIVRSLTDAVIENIQESCGGAFYFNEPPHDSQNILLDVQEYVKKVRWKLANKFGSYDIKSIGNDSLSISRSKNKELTIFKKLPLSPFHFLVAGIYLAEGDTKKDYLFVMDKEKVPLTVALTSSEETYLQGFAQMLENLGRGLVVSWKVKVGTKYESETEEIAQKFGVVTLRGGEKGQGYVRTLELDSEAKKWAIEHTPILTKYSDLYHHMEMTGAGIPRVHILSDSTLAPYFISLVRDMAFDCGNLEKNVI